MDPETSVAVTIDALNPDILAHIFASCEEEVFHSLPLVCKRFYDVLSGPNAAWQKLHLDLGRLSEDDSKLQQETKAIQQWFQRRGSAVQLLELSEADSCTLHTFLSHVLPHVSSGLQHLALYNGTLMSDDIHLLSTLKQLQELELSISLTDHAWQQHLSSLAQLTTLRNLEIEFDLIDSDEEAVEEFPEFVTKLPNLVSLSIAAVEGLPESLTCLQGLTRLRAEMLDPVGFPASVASLTNLQELHLRWGDAGLPVHVPDTIGSLRKLRSCILEGEGSTSYNINALSQLTGLTSLHLNVMALEHIPKWVSNLHNLKDLTMRHNAIYAIPEWLPTALPKLQTLHVAPQTRSIRQPVAIAQMTNGTVTYNSLGITVPHTMASMGHLEHLSLTSRLGPVFHVVLQLPQAASCLLHPRSIDGCLVDDEAWEVDAVLPKQCEGALQDVAAMVSLLHRAHQVASP